MHRRPRKIRRTGRHTTPSQVEKVAEMAGKAAPAVAIAGVLVGSATAANAAVAGAASATTVAGQVQADAAVVHHAPAARTYIVERGDTLSTIAQRFYGNPADWAYLYQVNSAVISNPNDIYAGEVLKVPSDPPASAASDTVTDARTSSTALSTPAAAQLSGTLGCSGLEALWEDAGGSQATAFIAAEIAMAESGGDQYALSPTDDYGYWQINASHGPAMATFNALGNAQAAIAISDNGTDWDPWTTYVTGAYEGRC